MIFLCRIEELAKTGARTITLGAGPDALDVLVVEKDGARYAYIDSCPHQFIPLETFPDHVFDEDHERLVCSGHWAQFEPETGLCVSGPCEGERLQALTIAEKDGAVYLDAAQSADDIARGRKSKTNW